MRHELNDVIREELAVFRDKIDSIEAPGASRPGTSPWPMAERDQEMRLH